MEIGRGEVVPFPAPVGDILKPGGGPSFQHCLAPVQLGQHLVQESPFMSENIKRWRVVTTNFRRFHINMNQLGVGEISTNSRAATMRPGGRRTGGPDGDHQIGPSACLIGG